MVDCFPGPVELHPGDTVRFQQAWTGERHSVTFGRLFDDELGRIRERLAVDVAQRPKAEELTEPAAFDGLPVMLGRDGGTIDLACS